MRAVIQTVRLALLALISQAALATPQQLMTDLQHMRLAATNAVTNFYMFSGLDADSKYERRIEQSMGKFEESLGSARQLAPLNGLGEQVGAIEADWNRLSELMNINRNDMLTQGFPNVRLVDEMGRKSAEIVAKVTGAYELIQESSGIRPSAVVEKARDLALLMEEITSQYAARGTTNLGQVFMGNYKRTLTEMAEDFQKELDSLDAMVKAPQNDALMGSVKSKWRFMEERIKNYNENTVPFLVVSYNDRIIEHLEELENRFQ
ncbi:hypothetical protein [Thalassolituus marinus]|uniref:Type IV pili methyl-accepting chemotaxis transducer N-term n=1 Tax=Thalassolituus marinus TaxID=671053 RepID=A0ABS7ZKP8_9GAMM|nr:hypothetical protein [Thalassolituus marinus]MCA6062278.1 hypothetical protein [Thalassolituus marinus]